MNLVQIGISHHTAPVEVREKMWLPAEKVREILQALQARGVGEGVLVSTCNRTELYAVAPGGVTAESLRLFLTDRTDPGGHVRPQHFGTVTDAAAVAHLFSVAAGIDSMVIGDIQILGQVKEAFVIAQETGMLGPVTNRLLQAALHVGKRVRTETAICEGAVSVSYAAVELAGKIFADLSKKTALLIGAGETGELTLKHLSARGIGHVRIVNRTRAKAEALATEFGATVVEFDALLEALAGVDVVISSVAGTSHVLSAADLHRAMRQRANQPLFIIDIGVPRNVEPAARKIDNVFLYDIDALDAIVDRNVDKRRAELPHAGAIVQEETGAFLDWYNSLQVAPTIAEFRIALETIRQQEVERNANRFKPEDRELLDLVTKRIVNKILHTPTTVLKQSADDPASPRTLLRIDTLRELFGISGNGKVKHD